MSRRPVVAVMLRQGFSPARWAALHEAGLTWDTTPYGYGLAAQDFVLRWSVDHPEGPLAGAIRRALRKALGFDLVHVWRNRGLLQRVDAVWTHTEQEYLAVALVTVLHRRRPPIIGQTVWLWDGWRGFGRLRRRLTAALLRRLAVEVVNSRPNLAASVRLVPGRAVRFEAFGTATPRVERRPDPRPTVLAPGNDRDRDWALLSEAAALLPDTRFVIASANRLARRAPRPNVEVVTDPARMPALLAEATAVAVPLSPNGHASGCTVALEAIGLGLPLVITRTGGIEDYVEGSGARLVPVGSARAFADALVDAPVTGGPAWIRERELRQQDYVARLIAVTRDVLAAATGADAGTGAQTDPR